MKEELINIEMIDNFKNHPFRIVDDLNYKELKQSIESNGLFNPVVVRKKEDGRYEMISGHRRLKIMKELGNKEIPCFVKNVDKNKAIIEMVDSNLHRDYILPSEKAFAYKLKLEAMKHQGKKVKTLDPQGLNLNTTEKIGLDFGESATNVKRYIRLTNLIPELLDYVDKGYKNKNELLTIGLKPAVELSFLSKEHQQMVAEAIDYNQATPSYAQTLKIRKLESENKLNEESIDLLLSEEKGNQHEQISFNKEKIINAIPKSLRNRDKRYIEQYIINAINYYEKNRNIERGDVYDLDA